MLSEFDVLKLFLGGYELVNGTDIDFIGGEHFFFPKEKFCIEKGLMLESLSILKISNVVMVIT